MLQLEMLLKFQLKYGLTQEVGYPNCKQIIFYWSTNLLLHQLFNSTRFYAVVIGSTTNYSFQNDKQFELTPLSTKNINLQPLRTKDLAQCCCIILD